MYTKILVANSSEALLYNAEELRNKILGKEYLIKKFEHLASRKKRHDLVEGDKGRVQKDSSAMNSAYESKHDPKEVEFEHFALELAHQLCTVGHLNATDKLLIVAPAHFYNLIAKHWHHKDVKIENLAKDYTKFNVKELSEVLREAIYK